MSITLIFHEILNFIRNECIVVLQMIEIIKKKYDIKILSIV